jgi:hypothetical protein
MVRIDESGHDDAAAGIDLRGAACVQVWPNGDDLLAFDQHVGLGKLTHFRVHRHHGAAADDVAAPVGPLSSGDSSPGFAAAPDGFNKLSRAAATAVAVEVFRKSRREPCSEPLWSRRFPSSHILHIFPSRWSCAHDGSSVHSGANPGGGESESIGDRIRGRLRRRLGNAGALPRTGPPIPR